MRNRYAVTAAGNLDIQTVEQFTPTGFILDWERISNQKYPILYCDIPAVEQFRSIAINHSLMILSPIETIESSTTSDQPFKTAIPFGLAIQDLCWFIMSGKKMRIVCE